MEKYAEILKGNIICKSHHLYEIRTESPMESKGQHFTMQSSFLQILPTIILGYIKWLANPVNMNMFLLLLDTLIR